MNREKFREIHDLLMEQLDVSRELSDEEILEVIDELILNQSKELFFSLKEKVGLRQELFCSVRKLDVLQELIEDESVTEIMVNGPDNIFVERAGKLTRWNKTFTSKEKLEDVIQQIVGRCNRVVNESMLLTLQSGGGTVYSSGYRMEKEETGAYEEKFIVSVDGKESGSLYVQVPEKETEDTGEETEPEKELSEEQQREKELQDMIAQYNQKKNDPEYYYLPDTWNGKHLEWEQPKDTKGNLIAALGLVAALAVVIGKEREKQTVQAKRKEQMLMDYPGLIMKFTLLVQAGLTARKAFQKIALDYGKKENGKERAAYEEIRTTCYEMDSGISEAEAYRRFGERCGQVKYKTLATLLIQNLQKGSRHLSDLLEKESVEAWEERKRKARVLGEAAATKLLLPMVLMLLVVMAVIMLPAGLSFYGG